MTQELTALDMAAYLVASKYLITKALKDGDGIMLRAVKTLMDAVSQPKPAAGSQP